MKTILFTTLIEFPKIHLFQNSANNNSTNQTTTNNDRTHTANNPRRSSTRTGVSVVPHHTHIGHTRSTSRACRWCAVDEFITTDRPGPSQHFANFRVCCTQCGEVVSVAVAVAVVVVMMKSKRPHYDKFNWCERRECWRENSAYSIVSTYLYIHIHINCRLIIIIVHSICVCI